MALAHYTAKVTVDGLLELPPEVQQELHLMPGQEIEIQLGHSASPVPNEEGLQMLREIEEIQKGMRETDGSQTDRLLREARLGLGVATLTASLPPQNGHFYFTASEEQFRAALDEIAQMNRDVPPLPNDAFDRETLYEDRL